MRIDLDRIDLRSGVRPTNTEQVDTILNSICGYQKQNGLPVDQHKLAERLNQSFHNFPI